MPAPFSMAKTEPIRLVNGFVVLIQADVRGIRRLLVEVTPGEYSFTVHENLSAGVLLCAVN